MISVSIVGVLGAVAVPSFQNYFIDARQAEGVKMLLEALRDQKRVSFECKVGRFVDPSSGQSKCAGGDLDFTELQSAQDPYYPTLMYKPAANATFRLVTGNLSDFAPQGAQFTSDGAPPAIQFGYARQAVTDAHGAATIQTDRTNFMMGAEANLLGNAHLLMVDKNGTLVRICNAATGEAEQAGIDAYRRIASSPPDCSNITARATPPQQSQSQTQSQSMSTGAD